VSKKFSALEQRCLRISIGEVYQSPEHTKAKDEY
jgi:hypothetical protein